MLGYALDSKGGSVVLQFDCLLITSNHRAACTATIPITILKKMSPENQWSEDVFPIEGVNSFVFGGVGCTYLIIY